VIHTSNLGTIFLYNIDLEFGAWQNSQELIRDIWILYFVLHFELYGLYDLVRLFTLFDICLTRNQTVPFWLVSCRCASTNRCKLLLLKLITRSLDFFSSRLSHEEGYLYVQALVHALLIQGLFVVKLFQVLPIDTRNVTPSRALHLSKDYVLQCCNRKCSIAG
jgi:hypothetical protein